MITVVDYGAGNLTSVEAALRHVGADIEITADPEKVFDADRIVFPGVGEARHAMKVLADRGLDEAVIAFAASGKPFLGICLGSQILQDHSEERDTGLLGIIPGRVCLFAAETGMKVPHMGWNTIAHDESALFHGIPQHSSFYFIHSYYSSVSSARGGRSPWVAAEAEYHRFTFAAALHRENVWATQFHPEKSGEKGLQLLRNFVERIA